MDVSARPGCMRMQASSGKARGFLAAVTNTGLPMPIRRMAMPEVSPATGYRRLMQASTACAAGQKSCSRRIGQPNNPGSGQQRRRGPLKIRETQNRPPSAAASAPDAEHAVERAQSGISRFDSRR